MKIYVGNLPRTVTEDSLRKLFETYGTINDVKIIIDRMTNQPRGFAFVDMPNDDEANRAIAELNGQSFEGRPLNINEARPQEQRDRNGRGGQGGGYSSRPRSSGDRPFGTSRGPRNSTRNSSWQR
ncbi:MAG: RNA-binding protein [Candidatus Babeliaceae bacterium]